MLIVDSHEDLAWNMLVFGRDYTRSAAETRRLEQATENPSHNGDTLLGWPDYQRGQVAVVFATLFAAPIRAQVGAWDTACYADITEANRLYRTQLESYHRLQDRHPDHFRLLLERRDLETVLKPWRAASATPDDAPSAGRPVGLAILMEGAEGVRSPGELEEWWALGVRLIGLAWRGNRFCGGTGEPGPLTSEGHALLEAMAGLGFVLDLSHMDERAALQSLEVYPGAVVATHGNALSLLKGATSNRHLTDDVIRGLIERDGVVGVVPYNKFLLPGWKTSDGRHLVTLQHVAAQIDYICQMAGDARHVGLGSDFDGGFGLRSVPADMDTIADLQKLVPLLASRGYSEADISSILGANWLRILDRNLPEVA